MQKAVYETVSIDAAAETMTVAVEQSAGAQKISQPGKSCPTATWT